MRHSKELLRGVVICVQRKNKINFSIIVCHEDLVQLVCTIGQQPDKTGR